MLVTATVLVSKLKIALLLLLNPRTVKPGPPNNGGPISIVPSVDRVVKLLGATAGVAAVTDPGVGESKFIETVVP